MNMEYDLQQRRWELENEKNEHETQVATKDQMRTWWGNEHEGMITRCYGWWTSTLK